MKTRKMSVLILTLVLLVGLYGIAQADTTATQTVSYEVTEINAISVSGNPGTLIISTATAGALPDAVSDNTTSYSITTNGATKKITAKIDNPMPEDLALRVLLDRPFITGASAVEVTLTTSEEIVVSGISPVVASGLKILYTLAPAGTTPPAPVEDSTTVTFTLTDS